MCCTRRSTTSMIAAHQLDALHVEEAAIFNGHALDLLQGDDPPRCGDAAADVVHLVHKRQVLMVQLRAQASEVSVHVGDVDMADPWSWARQEKPK